MDAKFLNHIFPGQGLLGHGVGWRQRLHLAGGGHGQFGVGMLDHEYLDPVAKKINPAACILRLGQDRQMGLIHPLESGTPGLKNQLILRQGGRFGILVGGLVDAFGISWAWFTMQR